MTTEYLMDFPACKTKTELHSFIVSKHDEYGCEITTLKNSFDGDVVLALQREVDSSGKIIPRLVGYNMFSIKVPSNKNWKHSELCGCSFKFTVNLNESILSSILKCKNSLSEILIAYDKQAIASPTTPFYVNLNKAISLLERDKKASMN